MMRALYTLALFATAAAVPSVTLTQKLANKAARAGRSMQEVSELNIEQVRPFSFS
jgi:hypothetical protein